MAFKKLEAYPYPRRLWGLVGLPSKGKSTFASQMRAPLLPIDADHRFDEVVKLAAGDVYSLSDAPADNVIVERIAECLQANMPGAKIGTIIIDSLTAIIAPLTVKAVMDNDAGKNKNRMSAFKGKALAMRMLQDAVNMWGTDVLYIYHLQEGRNENAERQITTTVSRTELARLTRSINLQLRIVEEKGKLGIHVDWARRGRSGMSLWDDTGMWKGMPERIEEAVYGGLSKAEMDQIERSRPASFASVEQAIAWGMDQGPFQALQHARNAFDKMVAEHEPEPGQETWDLWLTEVETRLAEKAAEDAQGGQAPSATKAPVKAEPPAAPPAEPPATDSQPPAADGPVLCPIHQTPMQLLVTREGKSLLLHRVDGQGYCNGQEVKPARTDATESNGHGAGNAAQPAPAATAGAKTEQQVSNNGSGQKNPPAAPIAPEERVWAPGEAAAELAKNPGVHKTTPHPWPGEYVVRGVTEIADWAERNPAKAPVGDAELQTVLKLLWQIAAGGPIENGVPKFMQAAFGVKGAGDLGHGQKFSLIYWAKLSKDRETGELIPAPYCRLEATRVMALVEEPVPF